MENKKISIVSIDSITKIGINFNASKGGSSIYSITLGSNSLYESIMICKNINNKDNVVFKAHIHSVKGKINRKRKRKYYYYSDINDIKQTMDNIIIEFSINCKNKLQATIFISEICKNIGITVVS